ncbi:11614_t:CDS:2, partial [Cetraspora pellucida]
MEVINDIEQEDIYNIAPPFVELGMDKYDEPDDIIHQNVQELWEFWQQKECTCRNKDNKTCYEKIGFCKFFKRQEMCHNILHDSLDNWIKGQLTSFAFSKLPKNKKKSSQKLRDRITYQYCYDAQHIVCLPTYIVLTGVFSSRLDRIKLYIKNNSTEEMVHGNIGRTFIQSNRATINEEILQEVNNFIHNYVNIHRFPLPADTTYYNVYEEYVNYIQSIKDNNYKIMSYKTFLQVWKEITPEIRLMSKASDLCDKCEQLHAEIRATSNIETKQNL